MKALDDASLQLDLCGCHDRSMVVCCKMLVGPSTPADPPCKKRVHCGRDSNARKCY
jgi:hypothetical protein